MRNPSHAHNLVPANQSSHRIWIQFALTFVLFVVGSQLADSQCCGQVTINNATQEHKKSTPKPNILFIAVDDLRPQLSCFGKSQMVTPNFERLAKQSVLFEKSYCMVPTCGASRASLMTSLRPNPRRFVSFTARADQEAPDAIPLNTLFKNNGYQTISIGKIYHYANDHADGWSEKPWRAKTVPYKNQAANRKAVVAHKKMYPEGKKVKGLPFESFEAPDKEYRDWQHATKAIDYLEKQANQKDAAPFFLAVGFNKPHLPFVAPKKYWDMYDFDKIQVPDNYSAPKGAPKVAVHSSGELRSYAGIPPKGVVDQKTARKLIHGYYACVSFIDAQLGRILDSLESSGLAENTIVVLWGDHGWQLGEHGMWNKHSCFETSMLTPLIVSAPGMTAGKKTNAIVEFIDIYPTLCELGGIKIPNHVEGKSFVSVLKDPTSSHKKFAVGRFVAGDTIVNANQRYSEYRAQRGAGNRIGRMLYDHQTDPNENVNVVNDPANRKTAREFSKNLNSIKGKRDNAAAKK